MPRISSIKRETSETRIELSVNLDGTGLTPLTTETSTYSLSAVANKGLILFSRYNAANSSYDIYLMDQTGANQTLVAAHSFTTSLGLLMQTEIMEYVADFAPQDGDVVNDEGQGGVDFVGDPSN